MDPSENRGGRRTRNNSNPAPVVSQRATRKTRKSAQAEEPAPENSVEEAVEGSTDVEETKESIGEVIEPTMSIGVADDDQPIPMDEDSTDAAVDDHFVVPEGNGVSENETEEQSESPENGDRAQEKPEKTQGTDGTDGTAECKVSPAESGNVLKRKIAEGNPETDAKKQKAEEGTAAKSEPQVVKPTKLPELEKYWKPVIEDATNFTGWTYLLQYVDQESNVEAAREAYDAFLGNYPYCYGYWRKYADYEKNKGDRSKCEEVFERGLKAIPLSVDLWIHYLNYVKASGDDAAIRAQYERALDVCGLEFRSDKLWEAYIKWETENKQLRRVLDIYDRLLATPTLGYNSHFGTFSDFVQANAVQELLDADKYAELKRQVLGESAELKGDELEEAIRKRVISVRKESHEATVKEVTDRWAFEEGVKRPYFHVKPLERCQLKNWMDYLDYEIECGNRRRIIVLFERCLIACALYEEYWQKYVRYLAEDGGEESGHLVDTTRDVYERACRIHHKEKPRLHLMWSAFEECQGEVDKAADILANIDEVTPNILQIEYRRISVERRRGNLDKCEELFRKYVVAAKSQLEASSLTIKHARFVHKVRKDLDRALEILRVGQTSDPENVRIPLQMIDLAMQRTNIDEDEVVKIMDGVLEKDNLDLEQKVLFAQRKVEFLEDFGHSPKRLQAAQKILQTARNELQEQKKAKSVENNGPIQTTVTAPAQAAPAQVQTQSQNQYANYAYYGQTAADASAYGAYSDSNYWNHYGQNASSNYYANYYQ